MPPRLPSWLRPPLAAVPTALAAAWHGRAYWEVVYFGGRVIKEVERDWTELPYKGRQELRLLCPDGQGVAFRAHGDGTGKFFQFKVAETRQQITWSPETGPRLVASTTPDGATMMWQYPQTPAQRPVRPLPARQVLAQVVGILDGTDGQCRCAAWEYDDRLPAGGRLVEFVDNATNLQYHQVGPLAPGHLGMARP